MYKLLRFLRKNEKGQGLIEYALLLAFIAGLALCLSNGGLKNSIHYTYKRTVQMLRGELIYAEYFDDWHGKSSEELVALDAKKRLDADCKALALIASAFLEKKADGVHAQMQQFSNTYDRCPQWITDNVENNYAIVDADGWSEVLVPLSYTGKDMDTDGYLWLESNNYVNTVAVFAPDAETHTKDKNNFITTNNGTVLPDSKAKTVLVDRVFYSDGMISNGDDNASTRTVAMKVHYGENNKVDKVQFQVHADEGANAVSNWNNGTNQVDGLNITVSGTSKDPKYTRNE